jgi:hypothetical protein
VVKKNLDRDTPDVSRQTGSAATAARAHCAPRSRRPNALAGAVNDQLLARTGTTTIAPADGPAEHHRGRVDPRQHGRRDRIQIKRRLGRPRGANGSPSRGQSGSLFEAWSFNRFSGSGAGIRTESGSNTGGGTAGSVIAPPEAPASPASAAGGIVLDRSLGVTGNLIGGATARQASARRLQQHGRRGSVSSFPRRAIKVQEHTSFHESHGAIVRRRETGDGSPFDLGGGETTRSVDVHDARNRPWHRDQPRMPAHSVSCVSYLNLERIHGSRGNLIGPTGRSLGVGKRSETACDPALGCRGNTIGGTTDSKTQTSYSGNKSAAATASRSSGAVSTRRTRVRQLHRPRGRGKPPRYRTGNNVSAGGRRGPSGQVSGGDPNTRSHWRKTSFREFQERDLLWTLAATSGTLIQGNLVGLRTGGTVAPRETSTTAWDRQCDGNDRWRRLVNLRGNVLLEIPGAMHIFDSAGPNTLVQGNYVGTDFKAGPGRATCSKRQLR